MPQVHILKQNDSRVQNFDPADKLDRVRAMFADEGFITDTDRFVDYDNTSDEYTDFIVGKNTERFVPIQSVVGPANQLIVTDTAAVDDVDFVGIGVDWFFHRYLGIQVQLNNSDSNGIAQNAGKFAPLMLTNVKATNKNVAGSFGNVVVCENNSAVLFNISSWGAAGYGYSIKSDKDTIADPLYITYTNCIEKNYGNTSLLRYASGNEMIVIQATDQLQGVIPGQELHYSKVTFQSWPMTHYESSAGAYGCDLNPPPIRAASLAMSAGDNLMAMDAGSLSVNTDLVNADDHETVVSGDAVTTGAPGRGQPSDQQFGEGIYNIQEKRSPMDILGSIDVYFFVFNSHADAQQVIQELNAPNPNIWRR